MLQNFQTIREDAKKVQLEKGVWKSIMERGCGDRMM